MRYIVAYLSRPSIQYHAKQLELCSEHTFKNSSTSPLRRTYISCVASLKSRMISGSFDRSPAITIDSLDACLYMNMCVNIWSWNWSRHVYHRQNREQNIHTSDIIPSAIHSMTQKLILFTWNVDATTETLTVWRRRQDQSESQYLGCPESTGFSSTDLLWCDVLLFASCARWMTP